MHNADFNPVEFDGIKKQAGLNSFTLTPKQWIEKTAAIGIVSRAGRYGGTYAHSDVAFEFASWVSVEFKLYLIKEFQRLKEDENRRLSLAWNLNRTLAKINYRLHTDAIQTHLIPAEVTAKQASITYANEADLLNVALFGQTAREWRDANPDKDGNMRDHATLEQLLVLANLENMNAEFIHMELPQSRPPQAPQRHRHSPDADPHRTDCKAVGRRLPMSELVLYTSDAGTYRPIAEIVEEPNVIAAKARERTRHCGAS